MSGVAERMGSRLTGSCSTCDTKRVLKDFNAPGEFDFFFLCQIVCVLKNKDLSGTFDFQIQTK